MSAAKLTAPTLRSLAAVGALVLLALCLRSAFGIEHPATPILTGLTAALALALAQSSFTGRMPKVQDFIVDAAAITLIAMARDPNIPVWQIPSQWSELLRLSTPGASIAAAIYIAGALAMPMRENRHLALHESISLFLLPFVFNVLLLIGARGLLQQLGGWTSLGLLPAAAAIVLGRFLVLFAFVEFLIGALSFLITGRLSRNLRLHRLLAGASIHAVLSVEIASIPQLFGHAPILIEGAIAIVCAALAQSGLWAFIYVTTGVAIEAVAGRPPTVTAALLHWNKGIRKGALFGALFATLAIVWGFALWLAPHLPQGMGAIAVLAIVAGALTFPFFATLVGSADETPPFFGRLKKNYQTPRAYMRGIVCGFGLFLAIFCHLPDQGGWARFGLGFAIGAFAYGGIDFLSDALFIVRGERHQFATWRLYAATMLMGGIIGGALGWYFDHPQLNVVADKLREYADLSFAASGRPATDYVIYPLFSKWGMMNLGQVGGGISLFFTESLSGVINWSLAAPLFGINYVLLEALLEKNLRPLRQLFSEGGLDGLVVQTVRVLRWGLWMAPVIFTFLKASPNPAWYNQDGAVRTIVATVHNLTMSGHDFRIWSLVIFTGLLAYDWLRVLIWFDHMGVRVATLVNLTFVGGDRLDRAAARAVGYAAPTRFIPESIRRFATWMPLLIPFYIPRGGEWDIAWSGAERLQTHAMPPEISGLIGDYILAGLWCGIVALFIAKHWTRLRSSPATLATSVPRSLASGRTQFALSNGSIGVNLLADGRGYRHIYETARAGAPLDLTRRPTDSQQPRGLFFYVRDRETDSVFSLGYEPCHLAASDYRVNEDRPGVLSMCNRHGGIRAEAEIHLAEEDSVEVWKVRLVNLGDHPRRLSLTSFQELAMSEFPAYTRDRDFHAMHVATWFLQPQNAIFARNRLLRSWGRMADQRMSQEIFFHAVGLPQGAKLLGYEDSRIRFFGDGDVRKPQGLEDGRARATNDEGQLYSFEPAASLSVGIDLPASGSVELLFINGHAGYEQMAAQIIAKYTGNPAPDDATLATAFQKMRGLKQDGAAKDWPFAFSPAGDQLTLTEKTPRPWGHVLSNPLGYGVIVTNDGEIHSFAGNERQNALTPYTFEPVPSAMPGQIVYVVDIDRDELYSPGFVPLRRKDTKQEVVYEKGAVVFRSFAPGLDLELTLFVPPNQRADVRLLKVRNKSSGKRRFRIVPYFDLVCAETPGESAGRIEGAFDAKTDTMFFSNPTNGFYKGVGFVATNLTLTHREKIRARFIGAAGRDLAKPFMAATGLSDKHAGDDGRRVFAGTAMIEIDAGSEAECVLVLGQEETKAEALATAQSLRDPKRAHQALAETRAYWANENAPVIEIESNIPHFDRLVNHWLHYEAVACRLYARGGPNQRSGAYGYRDQLQDVLGVLYNDPDCARRQILLHASQQFLEGDVLKWWHQTRDGRTGLGQRSRASDPHLWLPYVTTRYLAATGDDAILNEKTPYLVGPTVPMDVDSLTYVPRISRITGDLYEHCKLAIDCTLANFGTHGLPLFGTGDWNDGIDHLGFKGKGESVWMGFFLHGILQDFTPIIAAREGEDAAAPYRERAATLRAALDDTWRGDHYIVGYSDAGVALDCYGTMSAAWPALTGAVDAVRGLAALEGPLAKIEKADRVLLFDKPFDEKTSPFPGRIADYPPGLRENGGQYSHGASWLIDAYVALAEQAEKAGDRRRGAQLRARAFELWRKISPLDKLEGEALAVYGLAPHQQPADISEGLGHAGRGGWSWYTGAAARMLTAAYGILGLRIESGEIIVPDDIFEPKGKLTIRSLKVRGKLYEPVRQKAVGGAKKG